jgi:LPS-assembly protein
MKKSAIILAAFCLPLSGVAQVPDVAGSEDPSASFEDIGLKFSGQKMSRSETENTMTAEGDVHIAYGATTIFCDSATLNQSSRDVIVTGNVRIYREGRLVTAERAVYNLESKDITAADIRGESQPFLFSGSSFSNIPGSTGYLVRDGIFTTSDSAKPDWSMRSRKVRVYPNDRVIMRDVKLFIGETPIFWFPYVYQSLNKANGFTITPGYSSVWGAYIHSKYTFPMTETVSGELRLDYRSERGPALGLEIEWEDGEKKESWGRFRSYVMDDSNPSLNNTGISREQIDPERYRVSFQARHYFTEDIFAQVDINKLSDPRFLQDFYEGEFRLNPQPDSMVALTKLGEDFSLSLIARKQINDFYDSTERLPEFALDVTRQPLFGTKLFYEAETSFAHPNRNFADGSKFQDFNSNRLDSFHQLSLPKTFGGWLSVVPRLGLRGTWYSESGALIAYDPITGERLTDPAKAAARTALQKLEKEGSVFRPVINAGLEVSFKASKAFEQVQSRTLGLDGLRHVVQPYANFSFVHTGEDNRDILKFDRLQRSTQLPAIDFPAFNTIDSIDNWNIVRLGLRNRLQTRRDNATMNWLELNTFVDYRFDGPDFGLDPDPGRFSNLVNRLRWTPVSWVSLTVDSQIPLFDTGFTEVNSRANFMVNDRTQVGIGHRYINDNVLFQDSSLLDFGGYFRINDNWGFSFREFYEIKDSFLESQRYEVHRDLSSWIASFGFVSRNNRANNRGEDDYGVLLTFTLKDLPDVSVPLTFDPSSTGGSSRNR